MREWGRKTCDAGTARPSAFIARSSHARASGRGSGGPDLVGGRTGALASCAAGEGFYRRPSVFGAHPLLSELAHLEAPEHPPQGRSSGRRRTRRLVIPWAAWAPWSSVGERASPGLRGRGRGAAGGRAGGRGRCAPGGGARAEPLRPASLCRSRRRPLSPRGRCAPAGGRAGIKGGSGQGGAGGPLAARTQAPDRGPRRGARSPARGRAGAAAPGPQPRGTRWVSRVPFVSVSRELGAAEGPGGGGGAEPASGAGIGRGRWRVRARGATLALPLGGPRAEDTLALHRHVPAPRPVRGKRWRAGTALGWGLQDSCPVPGGLARATCWGAGRRPKVSLVEWAGAL